MTNDNDLDRLEDDFYDDGLADIETNAERKTALQRQINEGQQIADAIQNDGPLGKYLAFRRDIARRALQVLVDTPPEQAVRIAAAQAEVREFLRVGAWVLSELSDAEQAKETIKEEFDNDHGQDPDQD